MFVKTRSIFLLAILFLLTFATAYPNTYGSVEPIPNPVALEDAALRSQPLEVRAAFANRLLQCGFVDQVLSALSSTGGTKTINNLNLSLEVGAGGFNGHTNPAFVYTVIDSGPNGASIADIKVLTNSLGFVMSQGSGFLLDADNTSSFDFPANYVVINFPSAPTMQQSAAFFQAVGVIDRNIFSTDTSGYTQYGRAYLSLQSDVPDAEFIAGYVQAAHDAGLEYTPIVGGTPSLFQGGAAFPGNNWRTSPNGERYLARIPATSHAALRALRAFHLGFTQQALRELNGGGNPGGKMQHLSCH